MSLATEQAETACPKSVVQLNFANRDSDRIGGQTLALSGVAGFFLAWAIASYLTFLSPTAHLLLFCGLTGLPMILLSILANKTHLRETSGLLSVPREVSFLRCAVKIIGLLSTVAIICMCYWLFPEYAKLRYSTVWQMGRATCIPAILFAIGYFIWADRRMVDPKDGYWHFGMVILGHWRRMDGAILQEYCLGWIIKGFFLPFMLSGVAEHVIVLLKRGWDPSAFVSLYVTTFTLIFTIDTVFGAIGYLLPFRILDAQIRSPQTTWLGWVSTIVCYVPFSQFFHKAFLDYKGDIEWFGWLEGNPLIFISWGFAILVLQMFYVWATISFGCRFSNLTNRGIIVDGPYRYMKHPAYFAKNLSWWLISVPFVTHGDFLMNLKSCILLGLTNVIYLIRAKTEEHHLLNEPAYQIYAAWIHDNGLGASSRKLFGILKKRCIRHN